MQKNKLNTLFDGAPLAIQILVAILGFVPAGVWFGFLAFLVLKQIAR